MEFHLALSRGGPILADPADRSAQQAANLAGHRRGAKADYLFRNVVVELDGAALDRAPFQAAYMNDGPTPLLADTRKVAGWAQKQGKPRIHVGGARVLVMGLAFKENCPDLRNTRVVDIVRGLVEYDVAVDVFDPWVSLKEAEQEYGLRLIAEPLHWAYQGIVLAVAHDEFRTLGAERIRALSKEPHVLYDLKYVLERDGADLRL